MRKAKRSVQIEVLAPSRPSNEAKATFAKLDEAKAMLAKLVEQKVNEALSTKSGDSIFEPFFQPKSVADRMKQEMSVSQQKKFAAYNEKWGCMRCETKKAGHTSLGMCNRCYHLVLGRLKVCIRELDAERPDSIPVLHRIDGRVYAAQQAILDILKGKQ
jgi:hypothetical protein